MALPDFPVPEIHFFMSENTYCGSLKGMNYYIEPVFVPSEEEDSSHLAVSIWYGKLCRALSEIQVTEHFPLDRDGLVATLDWLRDQYARFREKNE